MEFNIHGDTVVVRLDEDDEIQTELQNICLAEQIGGASITGIGIVKHAVVGIMKPGVGYHKTHVDGVAEIMSLIGNVTQKNGMPHIHTHIVLAKSDGVMISGHLFEAQIERTAELFLRRLPDGAILRRNPETDTLF